MSKSTAVILGNTKEIALKNAKKKGLKLSTYIRLLILEADQKENK